MECFASFLSFSLSNNIYGCNLLSNLLAHDKSVSGEPILQKEKRESLSATEKQYS